jgi:hypothetical protein
MIGRRRPTQVGWEAGPGSGKAGRRNQSRSSLAGTGSGEAGRRQVGQMLGSSLSPPPSLIRLRPASSRGRDLHPRSSRRPRVRQAGCSRRVRSDSRRRTWRKGRAPRSSRRPLACQRHPRRQQQRRSASLSRSSAPKTSPHHRGHITSQPTRLPRRATFATRRVFARSCPCNAQGVCLEVCEACDMLSCSATAYGNRCIMPCSQCSHCVQ